MISDPWWPWYLAISLIWGLTNPLLKRTNTLSANPKQDSAKRALIADFARRYWPIALNQLGTVLFYWTLSSASTKNSRLKNKNSI